MNGFKLRNLILGLGIFLSVIARADTSLPLHTLRDQGHTDHCWAYSMSHLLESRALIRQSNQVLINVEKDVKYWVDYERMMYIHRSKGNFFLGDYEGGWQIEYFESMLKHGKSVYANAKKTPQIYYKPFTDFTQGLRYMPEPRATPDRTLMSWEQAGSQMRKFRSEMEAHNFAIDYLNRKYGMPATTTQWSQKTIPVRDSAKLILGSDYSKNNSIDSLVLIKPTTDGQYGWIRYLDNRYWGYRYDHSRVLQLIELSLNNKWPVTFDNVYHAMTILGYATGPQGRKYYAVADSIPGKITWYDEVSMKQNLNLITFAKEAIPNAIPVRTLRSMLQIRLPMNKTIDQYDNLIFPPR